ncbi:MAG: hypothetical protein FWE91_10975 [Defluviitaleaceae bacterium]|nr:hypothetical protein [Defluviitaleaceae bacterium]MCL2835197.1 hypothetical protein [Defluviitaleaceae bacterium]
MTDFQFKAIMVMVLEMIGKCKTIEELEDTKKAIASLAGDLSNSGSRESRPYEGDK